tara:strand:- start:349 stop:1305 length:957 start_codon:yes stop_codon:yes gene_type:complete
MEDNYLILTPDGVGSTYLQRALTVFLNSANLNYYNTHELLNGLNVTNGNLIKEYSDKVQSLDEICNLLKSTNNKLVSRVAQYQVVERTKKQKEDYKTFYNCCAEKFNKIISCTRDPFEYSLSWSLRYATGIKNVWTVKDRLDIHDLNTHHHINLDFFTKKLQQYFDYEYWMMDNFNITNTINYDDLHTDVDYAMQKLTGLDHSVIQNFGISLQDYSHVRYMTSMYKQTKDKKYMFENNVKNFVVLHKFITDLIKDKKLPNGIPIKMNTLHDKKKRVKNFESVLDTYNNWASKTNSHKVITLTQIQDRIRKENVIYYAS